MHHPTDRIAHTTAFVTPVVDNWLEREIAQLVLPMKDRSDDPSHHERTLLPRSYISLLIMYEVVYSVKYISIFSNSPCLHTISNAFSRSTNVAITLFCGWKASVTACCDLTIWSIVECCFLKPLCVLDIRFSVVR